MIGRRKSLDETHRKTRLPLRPPAAHRRRTAPPRHQTPLARRRPPVATRPHRPSASASPSAACPLNNYPRSPTSPPLLAPTNSASPSGKASSFPTSPTPLSKPSNAPSSASGASTLRPSPPAASSPAPSAAAANSPPTPSPTSSPSNPPSATSTTCGEQSRAGSPTRPSPSSARLGCSPKKKQPTLALINGLLAEQSRLQTPVAKSATAHDSGCTRSANPSAPTRTRRSLRLRLRTRPPTGSKACVSACHSPNGLAGDKTWRNVGLLVGGDRDHPCSPTVTTACHRSADPACLNGWSVLACEKDPLTGIPGHLDDPCIGCQWSVLNCPYDAPTYSGRLGIVRQCDPCHSRLAPGEAPACVQACSTHAIKIVTILTSVPPPRRPPSPPPSAANSPPP